MKDEELADAGLESKQGVTASVQSDFAGYLNARPEIGLTRMLFNFALEPQDPFKPDARRIFRKGFVIAAVFSATFAVWFVWFNVIR